MQDDLIFHAVSRRKWTKLNKEGTFAPEDFDLDTNARIMTVNATKVALDIIGRPIVNTVLLGAFAGATAEVRASSIVNAVKGRFSGKIGEKNAEAVQKAYDLMAEDK